MPASDPPPGGIVDLFRRIAHSVGLLVQARFDLFVVELQEEKLRTINLLVWLGVGFALGTAGVLVAIGTLALYLWELAGYAGLAGLAASTLAAAGAVFLFIRHRIRNGPVPFAATAAEFRKDVATLDAPK